MQNNYILFTIVFGLLLSGTLVSTSYAQQSVPNWFKQTAIFWANGQVTTDEFVDAIEFLIKEQIIMVPSYTSLQPSASSEPTKMPSDNQSLPVPSSEMQDEVNRLWDTINNLQDQIDLIETTPGPNGTQGIPGPQGIKGQQGDKGSPGRDGVTGIITYQNSYIKKEIFSLKKDEFSKRFELRCDGNDMAVGGWIPQIGTTRNSYITTHSDQPLYTTSDYDDYPKGWVVWATHRSNDVATKDISVYMNLRCIAVPDSLITKITPRLLP